VVGPTVLVSLLWIVVSIATSYYIYWQDKRQDALLARNAAATRAVIAAMQQEGTDAFGKAVEDALPKIDDATFGAEDAALASRIRARIETLRPDNVAAHSDAIIADCHRLIDERSRLLSETLQGRSRLDEWVNFGRLIFLVAGPALGILIGLRVAS